MRRRRDEGVVHHTSPRSAPSGIAAGGFDLLWRGGKDHEETANTTSATATVLGSSRGSNSSTGTVTTAATLGRAAVKCSPSSWGAYSPVDLRSAGRGREGRGLGLGSPPAGVGLRFGDEGEGEEDDDSPPRPRAFWREEWLGGSGGGGRGRGEGCSAFDCPRRGHLGLVTRDDYCSSAPNERAPEDRIGMARRGCCCRNDSSVRDERYCCQGGSSGDKGLRLRRCCSNKSLFRDARVEKVCFDGNSGDGADRRPIDSSPRTTKRRGLSRAEAEQRRDEGDEEGREKRTKTTNNNNDVIGCGEAKSKGVSSEGVSAVGLVVLAAVAVTAFATGTLVGPPHRQPPSPPSASTSEYVPLLPPHQTYKLTLRENTRARRTGPGPAAGASSIEQAPPASAGGEGGSCLDAVAEARGGEVGGVSRAEAAETAASARADHSAAMGTPGGEESAMPEDVLVAVEAEVNECERTCAQPSLSGALDGAPGSKTASSTSCVHPQAPAAAAVGQELGRQHHLHPPSGPVGVESGSRSKSAIADVSSSPGGAIARAGSSGHGGSAEANPSARSTSPFSSPGAWAAAARAGAVAFSGGENLRRRTADPGATEETTHPSAGSTPAAFAQTLGWAEKSLADSSAGESDESAERAIARRAAMSKSAARFACEALAWGKAALATGADPAPPDDDGVCDDTDSMWEDSEGGPGVEGLPRTGKDDTPGGGYGQAAERTAAEAATAAVVADDGTTVMSAEDTGLAGYIGLGPSSSSSIVTTMTEVNGGRGQGSPALGPRCRGLVLSGNDIQASWAGRYVPVKAAEGGGGGARQVPTVAASSTQRMQPQTPYYYCLVPSSTSSSSDSAVAEGGERILRGEAGQQGEDPPASPLKDALDKGAPLTEAAAVDRSEALAAAAARQPPTRSTMAANPRITLPAASTAGAAAAAAPENDLGLQEVTAGGVLCLYWADVGDGGRWVLDDDLRLSNGVLGVTKGPVPASADLAFPSRRRAARAPRPSGSDGVGGATASSREVEEVDQEGGGVGQVTGACRYGDASALQDGCTVAAASGVEEEVEGAVVGSEAEGAGGRAPPEWGQGLPTWLLDSPRRQDWVEAKNVFVECETV